MTSIEPYKLVNRLEGVRAIVAVVVHSKNRRVFARILGRHLRVKLLGQRASLIRARHSARFDWGYYRASPEVEKLYAAAKRSQWDAASALDWSIVVDPTDPERRILPDEHLSIASLPHWARLTEAERQKQRFSMTTWTLSQFMHGEQGALLAAAQITEAVPLLGTKLMGSTQVMDEARHVEVFHRYLSEKLGHVSPLNDNLHTILQTLVSDPRWDLKFVAMQIMIEGMALGMFIRNYQFTREPLYKQMLGLIIADEARHVHYGVVTLRDFYKNQLSERERREREDWTFEISRLLLNRFLYHEIYEEYYAAAMSKREWNRQIAGTKTQALLRSGMFKRIIPNLVSINLLTDRIRPHYERLGLLAYEHGQASDLLTTDDLLHDR